MTDIVERLREFGLAEPQLLVMDAAAEIERLRALLASIKMYTSAGTRTFDELMSDTAKANDLARCALGEAR